MPSATYQKRPFRFKTNCRVVIQRQRGKTQRLTQVLPVRTDADKSGVPASLQADREGRKVASLGAGPVGSDEDNGEAVTLFYLYLPVGGRTTQLGFEPQIGDIIHISDTYYQAQDGLYQQLASHETKVSQNAGYIKIPCVPFVGA